MKTFCALKAGLFALCAVPALAQGLPKSMVVLPVTYCNADINLHGEGNPIVQAVLADSGVVPKILAGDQVKSLAYGDAGLSELIMRYRQTWEAVRFSPGDLSSQIAKKFQVESLAVVEITRWDWFKAAEYHVDQDRFRVGLRLRWVEAKSGKILWQFFRTVEKKIPAASKKTTEDVMKELLSAELKNWPRH